MSAGTGSSEPWEMCSQLPIEHDLVIEGIQGTPVLQCTDSLPTLLRIQGGSVTLRNLEIVHGKVQTHEAELLAENVIFGSDAGIYGMSVELMRRHAKEPKMDSILFLMETVATAPGPVYYYRDACYSTSIQVTNSQWTPRTTIENSTIDSFLQEGIQVICNEVTLRVNNTNFSDRQVYVSAFAALDATFLNSEFKGSTSATHLGGISFKSFPVLRAPRVVIDGCSFRDVRFNAIHWEVAYNYHRAAAAVSFEIHHPEHEFMEPYFSGYHSYLENQGMLPNKNESLLILVSDEDDKVEEYRKSWLWSLPVRFLIQNSVFSNNARALSVSYDPTQYIPLVRMVNCTFANNSVLMNGGAIAVSGAFAHIENSDFINNTAGARFKTELEVPDANVTLAKYFHLRLVDYSVLDDSIKMTYEITNMKAQKGYKTSTGSKEMTGEGGAIHVERSLCVVSDTEFRDNTATKFGGTVYSNTDSFTAVDNSIVNNTIAFRLIDGVILKSFGTLVLWNSTFIVGQTGSSSADTLTHFSELDKETAWVTLVTVHCPPNSQLQVFNTSADMFSDEHEKRNLLGYKRLRYTCVECGWGNYSLLAGQLEVPEVDTLSILVSNRPRPVRLAQNLVICM